MAQENPAPLTDEEKAVLEAKEAEEKARVEAEEAAAKQVAEEEKAAAKAEKEAAKEKKAREAEAKKAAEAQAKKAEEDAKVGHDIAAAIAQGLAATKEDKSIRITSDDSVIPRFAVVRDTQTGEVMLRENESGHLSKVQLESIEEKEASIQGREVEEV